MRETNIPALVGAKGCTNRATPTHEDTGMQTTSLTALARRHSLEALEDAAVLLAVAKHP
jgi:hypothetical protein